MVRPTKLRALIPGLRGWLPIACRDLLQLHGCDGRLRGRLMGVFASSRERGDMEGGTGYPGVAADVSG